MKIIYYCQHVLGIGHFFRTLEICKALKGHEVVLVTGGSPAEAELPSHIREIRLQALMMDSGFKGFYTTEPERTVEDVKASRIALLQKIFEQEAPDLLLLELYPFGRKAFRFELDPVLEKIRSGALPECRVVCSLRDILVEKKDADSYENRVIKTLNRYFDALLVHADPKLIRLEKTFTRVHEIAIPIEYTGFVTPQPGPEARPQMRKRLGLVPDTPFIVASAGGGKVGAPLLKAVMDGFQKMNSECRLWMFTGPFMDDDVFKELASVNHPNINVERFTSRFPDYLAAADLSISMAGYNTCMNLMAARTPSLVWPFDQNREQRLRAQRLARFGGFRLLSDEDLTPERLSCIMKEMLSKNKRPKPVLNLDGAHHSAQWLESSK